jgi:hypothetical protein
LGKEGIFARAAENFIPGILTKKGVRQKLETL